MKNNRMFFRCNTCGNIVGMIIDGGVVPVCCDTEMELLTANTVDKTPDKHVPEAKRKGDEVVVKVGRSEGSMTQEPHLAWVALAGKNSTQLFMLKGYTKPEVTFCCKSQDPVTIYTYCGTHGLWASEA